MMKLITLVKEILSPQPKKKECNCGCDNCKTKASTLNESKILSLKTILDNLK